MSEVVLNTRLFSFILVPTHCEKKEKEKKKSERVFLNLSINQDRLFKIKAKVIGHIFCIKQEYSYSLIVYQLLEIWEI